MAILELFTIVTFSLAAIFLIFGLIVLIKFLLLF